MDRKVSLEIRSDVGNLNLDKDFSKQSFDFRKFFNSMERSSRQVILKSLAAKKVDSGCELDGDSFAFMLKHCEEVDLENF